MLALLLHKKWDKKYIKKPKIKLDKKNRKTNISKLKR
jgi:hypothetical protein